MKEDVKVMATRLPSDIHNKAKVRLLLAGLSFQDIGEILGEALAEEPNCSKTVARAANTLISAAKTRRAERVKSGT